MHGSRHFLLAPAIAGVLLCELGGCGDLCSQLQNVDRASAESEIGYSEDAVHALVAGMHQFETPTATGENLATSLVLELDSIDWMSAAADACGNATYGWTAANFELAIGDIEIRGPIAGTVHNEVRQTYSTLTTWQEIDSGVLGDSLDSQDAEVQIMFVFSGGERHFLLFEPGVNGEWTTTYGDASVLNW